jgi:hypothetical protein
MIRFIRKLIKFLFKFGPRWWRIGNEAYDAAEESVEYWKDVKPPVRKEVIREHKMAVFGEKIEEEATARGRHVSEKKIDDLRESVWEDRKENRQKAKERKKETKKLKKELKRSRKRLEDYARRRGIE